MAIRPYWFDASALIKLVKQEPGSNAVRNVVGSNSWIETTWLCVAEARGCLKRMLVKKEIVEKEYHKALYILRSWFDLGRITVRTAWLQKDAGNPFDVERLAKDYKVDFSDAIQLFEMRKGLLAAAAGKSEAVFVSSDVRLVKAARSEGFKVWNPSTEENPPA
jgi:predicted nucleic acid-binding protein